MNRKIFYLLIILISSCSNNSPAYYNSNFRIVSLSPSVTSQIIDLGAEDSLVGVTTYCPSTKEGIAIVGTYINPSIEMIISLKPDIVFMSEEDGDIQHDNFFKKFGLMYYKFGRNDNFETICSNYKKLSHMICKRDSAEKKMDNYFGRLNRIKTDDVKLRVVFLVSVKPLITVSGLSYISDIIERSGGINIFRNLKNPYPILTLEALVIQQPDAVIVMNHGDELYLSRVLENFKNIEFINKKNIFALGDENIPYYTPKDYVISVEKIYEILNGTKR